MISAGFTRPRPPARRNKVELGFDRVTGHSQSFRSRTRRRGPGAAFPSYTRVRPRAACCAYRSTARRSTTARLPMSAVTARRRSGGARKVGPRARSRNLLSYRTTVPQGPGDEGVSTAPLKARRPCVRTVPGTVVSDRASDRHERLAGPRLQVVCRVPPFSRSRSKRSTVPSYSARRRMSAVQMCPSQELDRDLRELGGGSTTDRCSAILSLTTDQHSVCVGLQQFVEGSSEVRSRHGRPAAAPQPMKPLGTFWGNRRRGCKADAARAPGGDRRPVYSPRLMTTTGRSDATKMRPPSSNFTWGTRHHWREEIDADADDRPDSGEQENSFDDAARTDAVVIENRTTGAGDSRAHDRRETLCESDLRGKQRLLTATAAAELSGVKTSKLILSPFHHKQRKSPAPARIGSTACPRCPRRDRGGSSLCRLEHRARQRASPLSEPLPDAEREHVVLRLRQRPDQCQDFTDPELSIEACSEISANWFSRSAGGRDAARLDTGERRSSVPSTSSPRRTATIGPSSATRHGSSPRFLEATDIKSRQAPGRRSVGSSSGNARGLRGHKVPRRHRRLCALAPTTVPGRE